jgi:hypothetical protein
MKAITAILLILVSVLTIHIALGAYGLRSGEVRLLLRLSDIDWHHERLRIRHSKTGAYSDLPLLRGPANAMAARGSATTHTPHIKVDPIPRKMFDLIISRRKRTSLALDLAPCVGESGARARLASRISMVAVTAM